MYHFLHRRPREIYLNTDYNYNACTTWFLTYAGFSSGKSLWIGHSVCVESLNESRGFAVDPRLRRPIPSIFITSENPSGVEIIIVHIITSAWAAREYARDYRGERWFLLVTSHGRRRSSNKETETLEMNLRNNCCMELDWYLMQWQTISVICIYSVRRKVGNP